MKLRELELLHNLISMGSVSNAARALHMSQPNASKILKKLEDDFGFQLFERANSRLHPTEEARLLFDQVERTLLSLRRFHTMTEDLRDMHRGTLNIGGLPLLSRTWLPDLVGNFMSDRPGISVTFHTRSSKKLIEWVSERQIDIALGMLSMDDPMVERTSLMEIEFVAALPKSHYLASKEVINAIDLDGEDFISLSVLDHTREDINRCLRQENTVPRERAGCSLPSVALRLAEKGVGITLVDHLSASHHQRRNIVFRRFAPVIKKNVWLLRPRMRPGSRLADEFIELLYRQVSEDNISTPPLVLFQDHKG